MGQHPCGRQGPLRFQKTAGASLCREQGSFSSQWDQPFSSLSGLLPSLFPASTMGIFTTH